MLMGCSDRNILAELYTIKIYWDGFKLIWKTGVHITGFAKLGSSENLSLSEDCDQKPSGCLKLLQMVWKREKSNNNQDCGDECMLILCLLLSLCQLSRTANHSYGIFQAAVTKMLFRLIFWHN